MDVGPLTCGDKVDHAWLLLSTDPVGCPAEQRPIVLLHRSRVIENGRRTVALDGLKGERLALRRPIKPPREVDLLEPSHIARQCLSSDRPWVLWASGVSDLRPKGKAVNLSESNGEKVI